MGVESVLFCYPFIQKFLTKLVILHLILIVNQTLPEKWILKDQIFAIFDEAAKLCKTSDDTYDNEG